MTCEEADKQELTLELWVDGYYLTLLSDNLNKSHGSVKEFWF